MKASFTLIVPAGGNSQRYGRNKLLELLGEKPVLFHTLSAFLCREDVRAVVIATAQDFSADKDIGALLKDERVTICAGGACRAESVRNALVASPADIEWVAIHDAARPLVSQKLIDRTLALAIEKGCAAPATAVTLTIKQAGEKLPSRVQRTLPRHQLWAMQTPQIMRRADLLEAYGKCALPLGQVTDDVQLLELVGRAVYLCEGEESNVKITRPEDLSIAERYLGNG